MSPLWKRSSGQALYILRALAEGKTQPSDIAMTAGYRAASDVMPFLERLREFRLIERLIPITAELGGRTSRYTLSDPFLAFWFRFVLPAEAALDQGADDWVLRHRIEPELDQFVSCSNGPWERACRDYLWRAFRTGRLGDVGFDRLGPWWEGRGATDSAELDAVGLDGSRVALAASCKWTKEYVKPGDLDELRRTASRLGTTNETLFYIFSRSGFDSTLLAQAEAARLRLVTPEMLFDSALGSSLGDGGVTVSS